MNWESTADGHHCKRHGETFLRGEVCQQCATDPGDDTPSTDTSDAIDRELTSYASEFKSRARKLWRVCDAMLDGTPSEQIQAAKLSAEAVKWERLCTETKDRLSARKHLREAMAHEQAMSGQRGHN